MPSELEKSVTIWELEEDWPCRGSLYLSVLNLFQVRLTLTAVVCTEIMLTHQGSCSKMKRHPSVCRVCSCPSLWPFPSAHLCVCCRVLVVQSCGEAGWHASGPGSQLPLDSTTQTEAHCWALLQNSQFLSFLLNTSSFRTPLSLLTHLLPVQ